jgi:ubiquinone/menaquinone biosynthesis C-methylase UbiE
MTVREHWDERHRAVAVEELSWFQPAATMSLELLDALGVGPGDSVIDVGGGVSPLAGDLLARGFSDVTVLDVSQQALDVAARRVACPDRVRWVVADVRSWRPDRTWSVWHDRATFHFLTAADDGDAYLDTMAHALAPGAAFVIATFAPDGPDHCSGLPTRRYDPTTLLGTISRRFDAELVTAAHHLHVTPTGANQAFTWIAGRRA